MIPTPPHDDLPDLPGLDDDDGDEEDEVGDDDPDARGGLARCRKVFRWSARPSRRSHGPRL